MPKDIAILGAVALSLREALSPEREFVSELERIDIDHVSRLKRKAYEDIPAPKPQPNTTHPPSQVGPLSRQQLRWRERQAKKRKV